MQASFSQSDEVFYRSHITIYNYADDNTISFSSPDFNRLIQVLQIESSTLINWFRINCMQANPEKFQAIGVGKRRTHDMNLAIKVSDTQINCEDVVKLLGLDLDYQLNFDQLISNLCRKAGQQLNVLKRLSPFLSRLNKLTIFILLYYLILITARLPGIFVLKVTPKNWKKFKSMH